MMSRTSKELELRGLAQTTVALTLAIDWDEIYGTFGPTLGGFPGVWQWIGDAAITFEQQMDKFNEDEYEYIDAIDGYGRYINRYVEVSNVWLGLPNECDLEEFAKKALMESI